MNTSTQTGEKVREFAGSTLVPETGLYADGPYPDGEMAMARLYKVNEQGGPFRAVSGLCTGGRGKGKSRWLEHKVLEHMHSGIFLVWFLDGAGGSSAPGLLDYVDWPATRPGEWEKALTAAARLVAHRRRRQTERRAFGWPATPDEPFIQIVIDQADEVLASPDCVRLVTMLLQEAEKTGIGVDLASRGSLMTDFGDQSGISGAHVIRGLAKDGNVAVFPADLPPGMHYLAGVRDRQEPVRGIQVTDPGGWARPRQVPALMLSPEEARACDGGTGDYTRRWERLTGPGCTWKEAGR